MINLYLTTGMNGSIWSGRPNIDDGAPQLYEEYRATNGEIFYSIAHNADLNTGETDPFNAIACGSKGSLMYSLRQGVFVGEWALSHTASGGLNSISYGADVYVAVGPNNLVIRSEDSGATWSESSGAIPGATWWWITAAREPSGWRFVAVGNTSIIDPADPGMQNRIVTGAIMYSDDGGVTWIKGNVDANAPLNSITYSPELNVYVAVGNKHLSASGQPTVTIVSVDGTKP